MSGLPQANIQIIIQLHMAFISQLWIGARFCSFWNYKGSVWTEEQLVWKMGGEEGEIILIGGLHTFF